jgi:hypothetical protein
MAPRMELEHLLNTRVPCGFIQGGGLIWGWVKAVDEHSVTVLLLDGPDMGKLLTMPLDHLGAYKKAEPSAV